MASATLFHICIALAFVMMPFDATARDGSSATAEQLWRGPTGSSSPAVAAKAAAVTPPLIARVQMHRNALRAAAYVPRWQADATAEPARIALSVAAQFGIDGDGLQNVRGNLYPIDGDGDGTYEFLHFNGYRFMRVYRQDGAKLWEVRNAAGRTHEYDEKRDTLAVLDADGDGRQEILHCWRSGAAKVLVLRNGASGQVIRQVTLTGDRASEDCHVAAFAMAGVAQPVVLVARRAAAGAGCAQNYADVFARVTAFTPQLTQLWDRTTCDAGHYVWPLDENGDGSAEGVFVGKYLLDATGRLVCTLSGFTGKFGHVDSLTVADLDPARAGLEVVAIGHPGTRLYSAAGCKLRWALSNAVILNSQHVNAAKTSSGPPTLLIGQKRTEPLHATYHVNAAGTILGSFRDDSEHSKRTQIANANIDGAPGAEDRVTRYAQVITDAGELRLDISWYWDLQSLTAEEKLLPPTDQWAVTPLVFDLDGDGDDEIVTWGRNLIVVGRRS